MRIKIIKLIEYLGEFVHFFGLMLFIAFAFLQINAPKQPFTGLTLWTHASGPSITTIELGNWGYGGNHLTFNWGAARQQIAPGEDKTDEMFSFGISDNFGGKHVRVFRTTNSARTPEGEPALSLTHVQLTLSSLAMAGCVMTFLPFLVYPARNLILKTYINMFEIVFGRLVRRCGLGHLKGFDLRR